MRNMTKKTIAATLSILMVLSCGTLTAFAEDVNSVASVVTDADTTNGTTATDINGSDTSQVKATEYQKVEVEQEAVNYNVDIYATQAAGEKVYDPTNPNADENGFVDGTVELLLPKTVILAGTSTSYVAGATTYQSNVGKYVVAAKGNISGTSYIKATPSVSFNLKSSGKTSIQTLISQPTQHFYIKDNTLETAKNDAAGVCTVSTSFDDTVAIGTIYTTAPITAGQWNGSPAFSTGLIEFDAE